MATTPPQRSFLSLPREIRDQIISYLLVKVEEPPTNPSRAGRRHSTRENVVSSTNHPTFRFTKLAHVSRQLRDEVADHGESMCKKGEAVAKLDVMFDGYLYYPTWTYVPALLRPGRPFALKIHTRLLTTESFRSSDRRPVTGIVNLFKILNAILRKGPTVNFPYNLSMMAGRVPYFLDTLSIAVSFQDPYNPGTWPEIAAEISRRLKLLVSSGVLYPHFRRVRVEMHTVRP